MNVDMDIDFDLPSKIFSKGAHVNVRRYSHGSEQGHLGATVGAWNEKGIVVDVNDKEQRYLIEFANGERVWSYVYNINC